MVDMYQYVHKFVDGTEMRVSPGWSSYKFHYGAKSYPEKVREAEQIHEMKMRQRMAQLERQRLNKAHEQCPGCGARKTIFQFGRTLCAYCKGEL